MFHTFSSLHLSIYFFLNCYFKKNLYIYFCIWIQLRIAYIKFKQKQRIAYYIKFKQKHSLIIETKCAKNGRRYWNKYGIVPYKINFRCWNKKLNCQTKRSTNKFLLIFLNDLKVVCKYTSWEVLKVGAERAP